jgi:hypothetical protein
LGIDTVGHGIETVKINEGWHAGEPHGAYG